jgi:dUTP pyrophosphatase
MSKFEKVSRFADVDIALPVRKTEGSAGFDFVVAEDIVIPAYTDLMYTLSHYEYFNIMEHIPNNSDEYNIEMQKLALKYDAGLTLDEMAALTKATKAKPTLVSTGMKCKLDPGTYLELSVRSSCPLKYWLVLANSVGIIDADYYNNPDNEGEIFFQMINLSPFAIKLQKGDAIGQGIIKPYLVTEDDAATGSRVGGFGSTGTR